MRRNGRRDANEWAHIQIMDGMKVVTQRLQPLVPGWPDLLAVIAGVPHFPEIKTPDGKLTRDQVAFRKTMASAGVSLDDYFPILVETKETIAWVARRRKAIWQGSPTSHDSQPPKERIR